MWQEPHQTQELKSGVTGIICGHRLALSSPESCRAAWGSLLLEELPSSPWTDVLCSEAPDSRGAPRCLQHPERSSF